jgi:hypothetical protein
VGKARIIESGISLRKQDFSGRMSTPQEAHQDSTNHCLTGLLPGEQDQREESLRSGRVACPRCTFLD